MKTKILSLLVLLLSTWSGNVAFAQFYDDADDILFYVNVDDPRYCIVLNFDGKHATFFNQTYTYYTSTVSEKLNSNPDYFIDLTSTARYKLKHLPDYSETSYCLRETRNGLYGSYTDSYVFEFSANRDKLYYKCYPQTYNPSSSRRPTKQENYKRVPKEFFITERVGRSNNNHNNDVIYE